jgi:Phosphatidylethanolamine-binding protein
MRNNGLLAAYYLFTAVAWSQAALALDLHYTRSEPPLEVVFAVAGGHYSGVVDGGNLFIQNDIPDAPLVRWTKANPNKLYTLMMIDYDGNAHGSWPDAVASGENSPVRHWIIGNIPGSMLRGSGYTDGSHHLVSIVQAYRAPHIPVVSDRYGIYLFEQPARIKFSPLPDAITNFDVARFLADYKLTAPVASNFFVAVYTSESPFSGKPFHGNDVSPTWRQGLGQGKLTP